MKISLCPVRRAGAVSIQKSGDILTINGELFDFTSLPNGATVPAGEVPCEWIVGPVERIDGTLHLTIMLPHGSDPSHGVAFPLPIIDPPNGPIELPYDEEEMPDVDA